MSEADVLYMLTCLLDQQVLLSLVRFKEFCTCFLCTCFSLSTGSHDKGSCSLCSPGVKSLLSADFATLTGSSQAKFQDAHSDEGKFNELAIPHEP